MEKNSINEMEEMRRQLDILKNKLEKQEIVNDRVIRESMKSKMSWINKYRWISLFIVPFVAICFLPMANQMNCWGLYFFTLIIVIVSVVFDFIINRMPDIVFMNANLLELSERMAKMKKQRRIQTVIGLIVIVFWLAWLLYTIYSSGASSDDPHIMGYTIGFMIAVGIGAIIGGAIGLSIFFKMQHTNDKIISQINELKSMGDENA